MFNRFLPLVAVAALVPAPSRAEDAIAPATVAAVKKSTVFVRVEGDGWTATGSGFVVAGDDKALLIATNHHVASPTPPPGARAGKPPALTVVFDSGTKTERVFPAAVVASDAERDLSVLRVAGVKDPPKAIPSADAATATETMQVYTFGFPFGKALASDDRFPAITVGKASVSSLRNGPDGELAVIQIDGNLNPGNSGGPVVDSKGKLVGVAVATIRDSQGIGLTIPAGELDLMLRGRVGKVRVLPNKKFGDAATTRVEAEVIDPTGGLRTATVHYLVVAPGGTRPTVGPLDKEPGSKKIEVKIENGIAATDLSLPTDGEVLVQVAVAPAGKPAVATRTRAFPLAAAANFAGAPTTGWKEYTPRDRSFTMWVPERPAQQNDQERTSTVSGERLRVSSVVGRTTAGLVYEGQTVMLPISFMRVPRKDLSDSFRDALVAEINGKVLETKPAGEGRLPGTEYVIEFGKLTTRVRMYVFGPRVYLVQVIGTAEQVASTEAETILSAYRLPDVIGGPPFVPAPPPGKSATVFGGNGASPVGGAPFFKDVNADGGLLIGVEVVVGRAGDRDAVRSVMPLYRVGKTEAFGKQFGTSLDDPLTQKAKPGYAVGGIITKAGDVCDGFALVFMRVAGDRLNPRDSYQGEWIGWDGPATPAKLLSDGTPVVGFTGRANAKDVTGIGLLFKGQESAEPSAPSAAPPPPPPPVRPSPREPGPARPPAKEPVIYGGAFDPQFKDTAPAGGLLVGFEIGTAQAFGHMMTRSARPIYRVGDKESLGEQRGTQLGNVVTLKAKAGYAVGAISVMSGLGFDGLSVTFMRVVNGKLDPKDSYESEYVGSGQKKPLAKLGGDGTPVIGIVGKSNAKDMTGMGLLFQGQEGFQPKGR